MPAAGFLAYNTFVVDDESSQDTLMSKVRNLSSLVLGGSPLSSNRFCAAAGHGPGGLPGYDCHECPGAPKELEVLEPHTVYVRKRSVTGWRCVCLRHFNEKLFFSAAQEWGGRGGGGGRIRPAPCPLAPRTFRPAGAAVLARVTSAQRPCRPRRTPVAPAKSTAGPQCKRSTVPLTELTE